jgi:inward rectifier potassium channel
MLKKAANEHHDWIARQRVLRIGGREIISEGLQLNFWADISHRCMTASWPAFIAGAAVLFLLFNAGFGLLYWPCNLWFANQPISNVPGGDYIDYFYFSIETLSTAGYGDMHPQTHYGHFIATIELFTGILSMSLMTGLIFSRFSRPQAPLLFAQHPVVSDQRTTDADDQAGQRAAEPDRAMPPPSCGCSRTSSRRKECRFAAATSCRCCATKCPRWQLSWTIRHVIDETSPSTA